MRAASLRETLAQVGPFFAIGRPDRSGDWLPLPLTEGLLGERVEAVRLALGGCEPRVAASVTQLGLAGRLMSPAIGAALLEGRLLPMDAAWWQPVLGPFPVALEDLHGVPYDGPLVVALGRTLLDGVARDLVELTAGLSVSRQVLWGNVASAVAGAVTMVTRARPELAAAAGSLRAGLLEHPRLRGTLGADLRRHSCCLIWRIAPPPRVLCADCVIGQV